EILHHIVAGVHDKYTSRSRSLYDARRQALGTFDQQELSTLRLGLSVFLKGELESAKSLRRAKHRLRVQERRYSLAHVVSLHEHVVE
ncbi:Na/Pi cotransporter family protein, partial [Pseudomonas aeruginosa]